MSELSTRESELVSLGAAVASNCVPCVEHHVPQARQAGLTDAQIRAAIDLADAVRQVPARKVLDAALSALANDAGGPDAASPCAGLGKSAGGRCC